MTSHGFSFDRLMESLSRNPNGKVVFKAMELCETSETARAARDVKKFGGLILHLGVWKER